MNVEEQIIGLRVTNAELATSVKHLSESVDKLSTTVEVLRDTMNKGRGALWAMTGAAGVAGAAITMGINAWLGRGP